MIKTKNLIIIAAQVLLISLIWLGSAWLHTHWLGILPATMIALFLILLSVSVFDGLIAFFDRGAYFLIAYMILMFVPLLVLAAENKEFFGITGLKIAFVIVFSTITVMISVGLTVKWLLYGLLLRKKRITHR